MAFEAKAIKSPCVEKLQVAFLIITPSFSDMLETFGRLLNSHVSLKVWDWIPQKSLQKKEPKTRWVTGIKLQPIKM